MKKTELTATLSRTVNKVGLQIKKRSPEILITPSEIAVYCRSTSAFTSLRMSRSAAATTSFVASFTAAATSRCTAFSMARDTSFSGISTGMSSDSLSMDVSSFSHKLDDLLEEFNGNLQNVGKIYTSIAKSFTKEG